MSDDYQPKGEPEPEVYRRPPDGTAWPAEENEDDIPLVAFVNFLLRHRWKLVGAPLLLAVAVIAYTVLTPSTYTADASLVPQAGGTTGQLAQLSGVASQFGIDVPTTQGGQSPQFYADLLTSRRLLEEAVVSGYRRNDGTGPVDEAQNRTDVRSLVELYEIEGASRGVEVSRAAKRLRDDVSASANPQTGVVNVSVTTRWPVVSKQVADRLIALVNRFNNRVRQSTASAEADFVSERLAEARRELRAAEDSLETFLQRNVSWQQSPALSIQHDRLQRTVSLKQQVYTSLATRYEETRISEVKNTPVVTTVTRPQVPAQPDPPQLLLKLIFAAIFGMIVGTVWALGDGFLTNVREENNEDYQEFVSLRHEAAADVKEVGRRLQRLLGGGSPRA